MRSASGTDGRKMPLVSKSTQLTPFESKQARRKAAHACASGVWWCGVRGVDQAMVINDIPSL